MQEPTVLVRVYGRTREKLETMRKHKYGEWGPRESLAAIIDRLADAAPMEKPASPRRSRRPGRRKVRR